ncbi:MAG: hypothetical protein ACTSRG_12985 [Candidatus Helarchaeota archaeon]
MDNENTDKKFKIFIANLLGIYINDIIKMFLHETYSVDVRSKKPGIFAHAIMFWCWLIRPRLWFKSWKTRHHHCAGVEIWEIMFFEEGYFLSKKKTIKIAISYDAQLKYERNVFKKWIANYNIINISNTTKTLNIYSEKKRLMVHNEHESLVGANYGKNSILGIIIHDTTKAILIGIDGKEKVICSESEMWAHQHFLPIKPDEPFDLIDVIERGYYIPMKKYNNELNQFM